jgi:fructokinase
MMSDFGELPKSDIINPKSNTPSVYYQFFNQNMSNKKIVCYGEVLWDMLPTGKIAGGAPMNVAYHLNALGVQSSIISRVGNDDLGVELKAFLNEKAVSTQFLQTDNALPTGVVDVTLDAKGSPSYKIVQPVAWDNVQNTEGGTNAVAEADAFVFGSLICRNDVSKQTLFDLLNVSKCPVFDVNLRPPFYDKQTIEALLQKAEIVKMNEEELAIISNWYNAETGFEEQIEAMQARFDLKTLIVSHGSKGAYCFENKMLYFQKAFEITVEDTIGSGDAFLAGFLSEKLKGNDSQNSLKKACAMGAFVATKSGATPVVDVGIMMSNFGLVR